VKRHYRRLSGSQFLIDKRAQLTIAPKMETEVGRREEAYQPPALRVRRRLSHVNNTQVRATSTNGAPRRPHIQSMTSGPHSE